MQGISPFLWFDDQAHEAAAFDTSVFPDSSIDGVSLYGEAGPGPAGTVMSVSFSFAGRPFVALNGGPPFTFTPAISFVVRCESQSEVDHYWERPSAGGETRQCGWLKDTYGLSWQVVPSELFALLERADAVETRRVMQAVLAMTKLDVTRLRAAFEAAN